MNTPPFSLTKAIFDQPDLWTLGKWLEDVLPPSIDTALLKDLRYRGTQEQRWFVSLVAARMSPVPLAITMHMYGRQLIRSGEFQPSIEPLTVALFAYRWADDFDGVARVQAALASAFYMNARFSDAITFATEAATTFAALGLVYEQGQSLLTLGSVQADLEDSAAARTTFLVLIDTTLQALDKATDSERDNLIINLLKAYINVGSVLEEQCDDLQAAQQMYRQAAQVLAANPHLDDVADVGFTLELNQAILALRLGRHTDATQAFQTAQTFLAAEDVLNKIEIWVYRLYQAVLLNDQAEANYFFAQIKHATNILKTAEDTEDRGELQYAHAQLFAAALVFDQQPEHGASDTPIPHMITARLTMLQEAEYFFRQHEAHTHQLLALMTLARLSYTLQDTVQARRYWQEAAQLLPLDQASQRHIELLALQHIYDPTQSTTSPRWIARQLRGWGDYPMASAVLTAWGERLEHGRHVHAAWRAYLSAILTIDKMRSGLRLSIQSIPFLAAQRKPIERSFALAAAQNTATAFQLSERLVAQSLLEELQNQRLQALLRRDDPALARLRALREEVEYAHAVLVPAPHAARGMRHSPTAQHIAQRAKAERSFLEEIARLQASGNDAAQWLPSRIATVEQIQPLLERDAALLSFVQINDLYNRPELWVAILNHQGSPVIRCLMDQAAFKKFLTFWESNRVTALQITRGELPMPQFTNHVLGVLYRSLIAPVEDLLAQNSRLNHLFVVYDEQLPFFPLHAARDSQDLYLIQRYSISYTPSASVLLQCYQRAQYRHAATANLVAGWQGQAPRRLDHVANELAALAPILATKGQLDNLQPDELLTQMAQARLIHLACHGHFPNDDSHPRFAHLELNHPAKLYAHDLYLGPPLQADVVTFSACDVGQRGKGMQGLVAATLVAGASRVVASLWPVADRYTPELMIAFYQALQQKDQGLSVAAALQQAQCQFINKAGLDAAHPAIWAPFFLTGLR